MFGFGKKKSKKEPVDSRTAPKLETREEETVIGQNGSYITRSYTKTTVIRETSSVKTGNITSATVPLSNSDTRHTIFSTNNTSLLDAAPFRSTNLNYQPVYRSVYTQEPFSRQNLERTSINSAFLPRRTSTTSLPAVQTPKQNRNLLPIHPVSKSTSETALHSKSNEKPLNIKVKKTLVFHDKTPTKVPTYSTHSKNRGKVLIINNIKFADDKQHREGAEVDEKNVTALFKQMGFKVVSHRDKTKSQMEKIITGYKNDSSLKNVDISIIIIMSHGTGKERSDSTEVVGTDDELLATTWILNEFNNDTCKYLMGTPKIFIFQCCRGRNADIRNIVHVDAAPFKAPVRKPSDMLIAYSTVPGYVSHRNPETGTWYIQTICEVFMEHAHDTDVESMLKIVDSKLANISTNLYSRQTSSFENRGFKNCFLHPV